MPERKFLGYVIFGYVFGLYDTVTVSPVQIVIPSTPGEDFGR
jgi:hypothetical protein